MGAEQWRTDCQMESIQLGMGTQMERFFFFKDTKMELWEKCITGVKALAGIPDLPLTGVWLWANYLMPLNLTFLIWKMGP